MDRYREATAQQNVNSLSCLTSTVPTGKSLTPRLVSLVHLVRELTDEEMRLFPAVLGEVLFAMERERAKALQSHVAEHCDVIWPGQAEMYDVLLASVDVESAVARVERSAGRQGIEVPVYSVVIRH